MIQIGSRVRLLQTAEDTSDVPAGSLGTVADIYSADDCLILVNPDCRPALRMQYYENEIGKALEEVL